MSEQDDFDIQFLKWGCHHLNCLGVHHFSMQPQDSNSIDSLTFDCMVCGSKSTLRYGPGGVYVQGHNEIDVTIFRANVRKAFSLKIEPDELDEFNLNEPREPYDLFEASRDDLNDLRRGIGNVETKPLLRKVLFQQYVTLLETFLGDTFTRVANRSADAVEDVIMRLDTFKESKVSYRELARKPQFLREKVIEHFVNISWHDLERAEQICGVMLSVSLFADDDHKARLLAAVRIRHDLVHRNGQTRDGRIHSIDDETLKTIAVDVDNAARLVSEAYTAWLFRPARGH